MSIRYWINNGGSWSDSSHWSLTSGGVGGASIPTIDEPVIFDNNSFSTDSIISLSGNCYCNSIDCSEITSLLTIEFSTDTTILNVLENITLSSNLSFTYPELIIGDIVNQIFSFGIKIYGISIIRSMGVKMPPILQWYP